MGTISPGVEGGILLTGDVYEPVLSFKEDGQSVVVKYENANIVHAGSRLSIFTDIIRLGEENLPPHDEGDFEPCHEPKIVTTGEHINIYDGGQASTITAFGDNTQISYEFFLDTQNVNNPLTMSNNMVLIGGGNSRLHVQDGYEYSNSTIINTGENAFISIAGMSEKNSNNLVVNTGCDVNVSVGSDSVVFSSESSTVFSLGKGSCAAILWHDGTRKRMKVVYEGEDGIQAGISYQVDQNGNIAM